MLARVVLLVARAVLLGRGVLPGCAVLPGGAALLGCTVLVERVVRKAVMDAIPSRMRSGRSYPSARVRDTRSGIGPHTGAQIGY